MVYNLLIEGQAKPAIKGNVEAAKLLLRYSHLAHNKAMVSAKKTPRLKSL